MNDELEGRVLKRLSVRELLQEVLDNECAELPKELRERLLDLGDHPNSSRPGRIRDVIQAATRE